MFKSSINAIAIATAFYNLREEGSSTGPGAAFAGETETIDGQKLKLTKADALNVNLLAEQLGMSKLDVLHIAVEDIHSNPGQTISGSLAAGEEIISKMMGIGGIAELLADHPHAEPIKAKAGDLKKDYLRTSDGETFDDNQWAFNDDVLDDNNTPADAELPLCNEAFFGRVD